MKASFYSQNKTVQTHQTIAEKKIRDPYDEIDENTAKITVLEKELVVLRETNERLKKAKECDTKKVVDNLDQLALYDACLYGGRLKVTLVDRR